MPLPMSCRCRCRCPMSTRTRGTHPVRHPASATDTGSPPAPRAITALPARRASRPGTAATAPRHATTAAARDSASHRPGGRGQGRAAGVTGTTASRRATTAPARQRQRPSLTGHRHVTNGRRQGRAAGGRTGATHRPRQATTAATAPRTDHDSATTAATRAPPRTVTDGRRDDRRQGGHEPSLTTGKRDRRSYDPPSRIRDRGRLTGPDIMAQLARGFGVGHDDDGSLASWRARSVSLRCNRADGSVVWRIRRQPKQDQPRASGFQQVFAWMILGAQGPRCPIGPVHSRFIWARWMDQQIERY
jgi:hypothetical protein